VEQSESLSMAGYQSHKFRIRFRGQGLPGTAVTKFILPKSRFCVVNGCMLLLYVL
jgi:hypothetical protein